MKFFVNGFWDSNKNIDLDIVGVNQNIKSFTQHTPNYLKDIYKSVLLNGEINYTASVKGKVKSDINPQLNIEYSITDGEFQTKKYPFILFLMLIVQVLLIMEKRKTLLRQKYHS